jgi:hypothetical protein
MHDTRGRAEWQPEPELDAASNAGAADGDAICVAHTSWPA